MPSKRIAQSYDDIVRQTVIEPDSSWRPSRAQERAAYEGTRVLSVEEQELYARVTDALLGTGDIDLTHVVVEIDRDRVILRGFVPHPGDLDRIERVVAMVPGVGDTWDRLVVGIPG